MKSYKEFVNSIAVILVLALVSFSDCQLALVSNGVFAALSTKPIIGLKRPHYLFSDLNDVSGVPSRNNSRMESEIAAIFRGVAYGVATTTQEPFARRVGLPEATKKSTTPSTTTEAVKTTTTHYNGEDMFVGERASVKEDIMNSLLPSDTVSFDVHNNTLSEIAYYMQPEDDNVDYNNDPQIEVTKLLRPSVMPTNFAQESASVKNKDHQEPKIEHARKLLGRAWDIHAHLTASLFSVVAIISLLCLCRINACCHLLPRGYFITLHLLLFLGVFFRCILFFHDPYGAEDRLPKALSGLLYYSVSPCFTSAFAVMFLVILRATRLKLCSKYLQNPLTLAVISGIVTGGTAVVEISSGVVQNAQVKHGMQIGMQITTVTFGMCIGLIYLLAFFKIDKAAERQQGELVRLSFTRVHLEGTSLSQRMFSPSIAKCAKFVMAASFFLVTMNSLAMYVLCQATLTHKVTEFQAWSWWMESGLERTFEILFCLSLLVAAFCMTPSRQSLSVNKQEQKVFSILPCFSKSKSFQSEGNSFTLPPKKSLFSGNTSLRSTLTEDTYLYKQSPPLQSTLLQGHHPDIASLSWCPRYPRHELIDKSSMLFNEDGFLRFRSDCDPQQFSEEVYAHTAFEQPHSFFPNAECKTLPNMKRLGPAWRFGKSLGYPESASAVGISNTDLSRSHALSHRNKNVSLDNRDQPYCSVEVASYYNNTMKSDVSGMYCMPHARVCNNTCQRPSNFGIYCELPCQGFQESVNKPSNYSSRSEIHVDYLTDFSSNDCLSRTPQHRTFTLPLTLIHSSPVVENSDSTPDSGVVLDYSSHIGSYGKPCSTLELLKLSSSSLNDILKGQGIFNKFVGGATQGYSPLDVDESLRRSQDFTTKLQRAASSNCLLEQGSSGKESCSKPFTHSGRISPVTSL